MDKFCKNCKEDIKENDFYVKDIAGNFIHITCSKAYIEYDKTIADKIFDNLFSVRNYANDI